MIERRPVDDLLVGFALGMDQELLNPHREFMAVQLLEELLPRTPPPNVATILCLGDEYKSRFSADFRAATPSPRSDPRKEGLSRLGLLHLTIAASFGYPYGVLDGGSRVVVQDVYPVPTNEHQPNSTFGSRKILNFHTDQASNPDTGMVPDTVVLGCIRNQEKGVTRVADLAAALSLLNNVTLYRLRQPDYQFFDTTSLVSPPSKIGPILFPSQIGYTARLGSRTDPLNDLAAEAEMSLREALDASSEDVCLEPGEILVIPNRITPHARLPFVPHENPAQRRWMQRVFVHNAA